jgi:hypothetical protein
LCLVFFRHELRFYFFVGENGDKIVVLQFHLVPVCCLTLLK